MVDFGVFNYAEFGFDVCFIWFFQLVAPLDFVSPSLVGGDVIDLYVSVISFSFFSFFVMSCISLNPAVVQIAVIVLLRIFFQLSSFVLCLALIHFALLCVCWKRHTDTLS